MNIRLFARVALSAVLFSSAAQAEVYCPRSGGGSCDHGTANDVYLRERGIDTWANRNGYTNYPRGNGYVSSSGYYPEGQYGVPQKRLPEAIANQQVCKGKVGFFSSSFSCDRPAMKPGDMCFDGKGTAWGLDANMRWYKLPSDGPSATAIHNRCGWASNYDAR
jgi:hypothetical protein